MIRSVTEPFTYPGVKFFLLLAGGIVLGDMVPVPDAYVLPGMALLIALTALADFIPIAKRHASLRLVAIAIAALGLGFMLQHYAITRIDASAVQYTSAGTQRDMRAIVASEPELLRYGYTCNIDLIEVTTESEGPVHVSSKGSFLFTRSMGAAEDTLLPARGDTLVMHGWLNTPRSETVPDGFDYRAFLNRQGITVTAHAYGEDAVRVHPKSGFSIWKPVHTLRMYVYNTVGRYAPHREGILVALLLGDRGRMSSDVQAIFRSAGIVHILAVSGLHTGIILLMFYVLLLRLPLKWRIPLVIAGLVLYAMATGLAPPVIRASIIAIIFLLGRVLQRNTPPVNAIALAGAAILLFDPQSLFTLSFQLSFLAAFAIALFYKPIDEFIGRWEAISRYTLLRYIRGIIAVTIAAQIGTVPVILSVFGSISIVSLFTNLLAVPLAFFIVTVSIAGLILGAVIPAVGGWLITASGAAADVLVFTSTSLARLPFAELHPGPPPWWVWLVYGGAVLYLAFGKAALRTKAVLAAISVAAVIAVSWLVAGLETPPNEFEIAFLDVGQGDATLITTPAGGRVLIDAGPNYRNTDAGRRVILPYLRMRGIDHLDAVVLTHADTDHIGGAESVLAGVDVDTVYYSGISNTKSATRDLDSVVALRNVPVKQIYAGDLIYASKDARFYVLAPFRKPYPEESDNDASIVILAVYGSTSALFTGDADVRAEGELVERYRGLVDVDVLKIGHHGSASSTSRVFLDSASPQYAVISCGRNNRYGHPARRVTSLLGHSNIKTFRTDRDGTVILSSEGHEFKRVRWNK